MGKGFDTFMANPYWRKIYEEAEERLAALPLSKSDIQYIQRFAGSGMARSFYERFIQRLTGEHEGRCFPAAAFQAEEWNPWYNAEPDHDGTADERSNSSWTPG